MNILRFRRTGIAAAAAAVIAGAALLAPSAATAAPAATTLERAVPAATGDAGWLRLGHFSPDTKAVDVRVAALSGGSVILELSDVGYGDISPYQEFAAGSYTISMIPSGSNDWSKVALSDTVTIGPAGVTTVAAYGPNAQLQLRAFSDDLTGPAAGNARLRVVQASTVTPTVDVQTSTGVAIANDAREGTATPYAEVPAGSWTVELTGGSISETLDVDVAAGSVTTLFVLDTADGGLTILPVLDSAGAPLVPRGGVQTGGGFLASGSDVARIAPQLVASA